MAKRTQEEDDALHAETIRLLEIANRQSVTVNYNEMHLDVTPSILQSEKSPRTSFIAHSKLEEPVSQDRLVTANPWGFTDWFISQVSQDKLFGANYQKRYRIAPIPEYIELEMKPLQLIALILLKRFRNLRYSEREGRMPPSVMLSKLVADILRLACFHFGTYSISMFH